MKVNENLLREVLRDAIADANRRPNTFEKQIKTTMSHMYNITAGESAFILNGRTPVETMSDDIMYKITRVLYELNINIEDGFDTSKLNVDTYFTENEKIKYEQKINREIVDEDIVCDYWIPIANDEVVIRLSNKQTYKLISANKIHYNPETQRNLTVIETDNGQIKKVTIDNNAINSIAVDMGNGDYIPNAITFNINPDLYPQPRIFKNKFVIPKESVIDCINGYHRIIASVMETKLNPNLEFNFIVIITGFDVKKAKKYILQENYKVPLTEEQVEEDDQDNAANFIIEKLKQSMYLKNSNISDISLQLNRIINQIFKPEKLKSPEARQKALLLFKNIENNMNDLIESNNYIGKNFTQEEWFIYLYLIDFCINNNSNFISMVSDININGLLKEIKLVNKPIQKHFNIMSEVIKNVQRR